MDNSYIYVITALLPLAAAMLVFQVNPYHALVIRGVLGAIAALVYTVLGAADVALTEALVGTLLAITLYAVAVRSSLVFRLGVLKDDLSEVQELTAADFTPLQQIVNGLNTVFKDHHLRVELVPYFDREELHRALMDKEVHATCERGAAAENGGAIAPDAPDSYLPPYRTTTRLRRLYDIMNSEFLSPITQVSYIDPSAVGEVNS
jgi:putative multicomponent Na+:H+ antiporter subunit B